MNKTSEIDMIRQQEQQEYKYYYSKHDVCGAINPMDKSLKSWCGKCCRAYHLVHEGVTVTFEEYERYVRTKEKGGDKDE